VDTTTMAEAAALLRLLQLTSPALPVGAFSYSEGLETLVADGAIASAADLGQWLQRELRWGSIRLEGAVLLRCLDAFGRGDGEAISHWNQWLTSLRETEELRLQNAQMGRSLQRLLLDLPTPDGDPAALHWLRQADAPQWTVAYAAAAHLWGIPAQTALLGLLQSWAHNLISAGVRLVPLGQTDGQRLLLQLDQPLHQAVAAIAVLADGDLVACSWGQSLASMRHEVQYSRLFRS
jgi:urease accessory protein